MTMKKRIMAMLLAIGFSVAAFPILPALGAEEHVDSRIYEVEASEGEVDSRAADSRAIPSGAYSIDLNVNGRRVLRGRVFNLGGITYVPMFAFADWLGNFSYSYNSTTATARVEGENLEIAAHAGDLYIR